MGPTKASGKPHTRAERRHPEEAPPFGPDELAAYVGVPLMTIYKWRATKRGPKAARVGRYLRYRRGDVDDWLAAGGDNPAT